MFKYTVIIALLISHLYSYSQDTTIVIQQNIFEELRQINDNGGYVSIKGNPDIEGLVRLHIQTNQNQKSISGYRIQIFSGSSYDYNIERLQGMKSAFEKDFPDIPVYLNYFDPDFKIRAGNFRSRLDCIPALKRIRIKYPSSYPVKTDIPLNDLRKASGKNLLNTGEEANASISDL